MLPELKRKTNLGVGIGIIIQIVGRVLVNTGESALAWLGFIIVLAGLALFIWGCAQYAKAKGHSGWFGAFGILSIIGLVVLALLTDKHKEVNA